MWNKKCIASIATGKVGFPETAIFAKFSEVCSWVFRKTETFEERNERQKLHIFVADLGKKKVQTSNGKVLAACFVSDLFGS